MRKFQFPAILFSVLAIFLGALFFAPQQVSAADTPCFQGTGLNLGNCLTLGSGKTVGSVYAKPADLVNVVVRNIFVLGGLILFFMIIYSGFLFISGGEKGIEQASSVITTALIGFLIMFAAFWILRIISLVTGADILF